MADGERCWGERGGPAGVYLDIGNFLGVQTCGDALWYEVVGLAVTLCASLSFGEEGNRVGCRELELVPTVFPPVFTTHVLCSRTFFSGPCEPRLRLFNGDRDLGGFAISRMANRPIPSLISGTSIIAVPQITTTPRAGIHSWFSVLENNSSHFLKSLSVRILLCSRKMAAPGGETCMRR